jgi:phospholipase A-2-activating protein
LRDLEGHQQSVWAVIAIDDDRVLTGAGSDAFTDRVITYLSSGSADKTIKLWQEHKNVRTYRGHQDAVRGLALITDIGFASCSNDR